DAAGDGGELVARVPRVGVHSVRGEVAVGVVREGGRTTLRQSVGVVVRVADRSRPRVITCGFDRLLGFYVVRSAATADGTFGKFEEPRQPVVRGIFTEIGRAHV